jgi:hypothetical protein
MRKKAIATYIKRSKKYFGFLIILLTAAVFIAYIRLNPGALDPIKSAPVYVIPVVLVLYGLFLLTNFVVTVLTIKFSGKDFPAKGSLLLTVYSTLINFFGPLQSGPGFRAVYLKKKIGLSIKDYTLITLLYYGSFFAISMAMVFGFAYPYPTLLLLGSIFTVGLWFFRKEKIAVLIKRFLAIAFVTLIQITLIAIIYNIELRAVGYQPSIASTLIYTGSANLALFVALTPGAIGIRESFIYFSQSLHNIPTDTIVNAGLLDRAIYIIFLGTLFVLSSSLHIGKKINSARAQNSAS